MITTVLFDLDDTLLDFKRAEAQALRKVLLQFGITPTNEIIQRYSVINQQQWELLEQGVLTRDQLLHRRFDIFFAELGINQSSHRAQALYEHLLAQEHDLIPGARCLLETLYRDYDLYLVSNGTAIVQTSRIGAAGIGHYFKGIFLSEQLGADKPSHVFFDRCFHIISPKKRISSIIVGDSLTSDIQGGKNAGILTCWFHPPGRSTDAELQPDYEITALSQLPGLLGRL